MRRNLRRNRRLDFFILAAVSVVVAVAAADSLRSSGAAPAQAGTADSQQSRTLRPTRTQEVRNVGDEWASRFARGAGGCVYMTQALCERLACAGPSLRKLESCTRPTRAYRRTFEGARVYDVAFKDSVAAARLSNGAVIELLGAGEWWLVQRVGAKARRGFFESRERPRRTVAPHYR